MQKIDWKERYKTSTEKVLIENYYWYENSQVQRPIPLKTIFFISQGVRFLGFYFIDKDGEGSYHISSNHAEKNGQLFPVRAGKIDRGLVQYFAYMPDIPNKKNIKNKV